MTLRLVRPPSEGQPTRPPKGRRSAALSLTSDEARHLRAAIKNTARALGGMPVLAEATGLSTQSLEKAAYHTKGRPSPALALLIARAAGMSVEAVIGGRLTATGRCEGCGARVGQRSGS